MNTKYHQKLKISLLLICLFIINTGSAKSAPQWLKGADDDYPKDQYILVVGTGDTEALAEKNAKEVLVAKISKLLQPYTQKTANFFSSEAGKKILLKREIQIEKLVTDSMTIFTDSATFEDKWTSPEQVIHKLLLLKIAQISEIASEQIHLEQGTIDSNDVSQSESRDPGAIQNYNYEILQALTRRDTYVEILRLHKLKPTAEIKALSMQKIINRLTGAAIVTSGATSATTPAQSGPTRLVIEINGPFKAEVRGAIVALLSKKGYAMVDTNTFSKETTDYVIEGLITLERVPAQGSDHFVRWQINLNIMSTEPWQKVGNILKQDREGHANYEGAERRAMQNMIKEIEGELSELSLQ